MSEAAAFLSKLLHRIAVAECDAYANADLRELVRDCWGEL